MDKVAFLIMAHKNPEQVERLAKRLTSSRSDVYLHWDKNSGEIPADLANVVIQTPRRHHGERFEFSLVEISNELIRTAYEKNGSEYKYYYLLSGQDYPLCSVNEIIDVLLERFPEPFIDCTPWDNGNWIDNVSKSSPWYSKICREMPKFMREHKTFRRLYKVIPWLVDKPIQHFFSCKVLLDREGIDLYGGGGVVVLA